MKLQYKTGSSGFDCYDWSDVSNKRIEEFLNGCATVNSISKSEVLIRLATGARMKFSNYNAPYNLIRDKETQHLRNMPAPQPVKKCCRKCGSSQITTIAGGELCDDCI